MWWEKEATQRTVARIGIAGVALIVACVLTVAAIQLASAPGTPSAGSRSSPQVSSSTAPTTVVDPTGILLIDVSEQVQASPPSEEMAVAFSGLIDLAMANPEDLGYPWIDPETHELVLSAATNAGRAVLQEAAADLRFPYRIRDVAHSRAELQRIQDDATRLVAEGLPDADLIYEIVPDWRDNRTMIVISEISQPLLEALAQRFPPDALAVQVDPSRGPAGYLPGFVTGGQTPALPVSPRR